MENLKNPKGTLEELAAEYGFTKPSYILANANELAQNKTFYEKCVLIDHKHNKTFIEHINEVNRLENSEDEATRKILKIL